MSKTREELRASLQENSNLSVNAIREIQRGERLLQKKQERQERIESSLSYQAVKKGVFFKEIVDPVIGFFIPGIGDIVGSVLSLPALYVAIFYVKSFPLVLAILYYNLVDFMISTIPFIGNIIDIFYLSHRKSAKVLVGFVEDNEEIKREVRNKAIWMGIGILILCFIIYWLIKWVALGMSWVYEQVAALLA